MGCGTVVYRHSKSQCMWPRTNASQSLALFFFSSPMQTRTHTHRAIIYCNPHCAWALKVNEVFVLIYVQNYKSTPWMERRQVKRIKFILHCFIFLIIGNRTRPVVLLRSLILLLLNTVALFVLVPSPISSVHIFTSRKEHFTNTLYPLLVHTSRYHTAHTLINQRAFFLSRLGRQTIFLSSLCVGRHSFWHYRIWGDLYEWYQELQNYVSQGLLSRDMPWKQVKKPIAYLIPLSYLDPLCIPCRHQKLQCRASIDICMLRTCELLAWRWRVTHIFIVHINEQYRAFAVRRGLAHWCFSLF